MSTTYEVVLALSTTGNLSATVGEIGAKAGSAHEKITKLGSGMKEVGSAVESVSARVGGALASMVDRVEGLAVGFAKVGASLALAGAVYGVGNLNNELEQTSVSLAAIFQAQGFSSTFAKGMTGASEQVAKMKQDVKALPGDLGQLSNTMKTILPGAAQAGVGVDDIRKLAGDTMLVGKILGVDSAMAGREMAQLLAGRAGGHNVLGSRMGIDAKKFNAESAADRYKDIEAKMAGYGGAKDAFANTFVAQWTTAIDNVKYQLLQPMTMPLFEHVKATVGRLNDAFDRNHDKVVHFVNVVGDGLAHAWDKGVEAALKLEPVVGRIAGYIEHLDMTKIAHGMEGAGGAMLAAKMLPSVISGGGSLAGSLISGMGSFVGGGGGGGMMATPAGLAVGGAALTALGVVAAGAAGAIWNMTDASSVWHDQAVGHVSNIERSMIHVTGAFERLTEDARPRIESLGDLFLGALDTAVSWGASALDLADKFSWLGTTFLDITPGLQVFGAALHLLDLHTMLGPASSGIATAGHYQYNTINADPWNDASSKSWADLKPHPSPTTNIQKVEIVVKGSDDPSRVARLTLLEIEKLGRHPKSSSYVPNYTSRE